MTVLDEGPPGMIIGGVAVIALGFPRTQGEKEVGRKLAGFDEQLFDYFGKAPSVKLGILTNGAQWRFFTDLSDANVMDKEPFAKWDIFSDEPLLST